MARWLAYLSLGVLTCPPVLEYQGLRSHQVGLHVVLVVLTLAAYWTRPSAAGVTTRSRAPRLALALLFLAYLVLRFAPTSADPTTEAAVLQLAVSVAVAAAVSLFGLSTCFQLFDARRPGVAPASVALRVVGSALGVTGLALLATGYVGNPSLPLAHPLARLGAVLLLAVGVLGWQDLFVRRPSARLGLPGVVTGILALSVVVPAADLARLAWGRAEAQRLVAAGQLTAGAQQFARLGAGNWPGLALAPWETFRDLLTALATAGEHPETARFCIDQLHATWPDPAMGRANYRYFLADGYQAIAAVHARRGEADLARALYDSAAVLGDPVKLLAAIDATLPPQLQAQIWGGDPYVTLQGFEVSRAPRVHPDDPDRPTRQPIHNTHTAEAYAGRGAESIELVYSAPQNTYEYLFVDGLTFALHATPDVDLVAHARSPDDSLVVALVAEVLSTSLPAAASPVPAGRVPATLRAYVLSDFARLGNGWTVLRRSAVHAAAIAAVPDLAHRDAVVARVGLLTYSQPGRLVVDEFRLTLHRPAP